MDDDDSRHVMRAGRMEATVLAQGAELCSLRRTGGRELIWQAGAAWPSHAPVLFPIVGALRDGALRVDGRTYKMGRHGFARRTRFAWLERTEAGCMLALGDTADTRAQYPFAFRLEVAYALADGALHVTMAAVNTGNAPLPCSLGFHPAFNWPLDGGAKADHRIEMAATEAETVEQLDAAGLVARRVATPLEGGRVLPLSDAVFAADALILDPVRSTAARYLGPDGRGVEVGWDGAMQLGIWSKQADFVCIEPWRGLSSPAGFTGEFRDKPGLAHVPPGERAVLAMTLRPIPD